MRRTRLGGLAAALGLVLQLLLARATAAHTRSESHSSWMVDGRVVDLSFSVSDVEAARIARGARPSDAQLIAYLEPRLSATARGKPCPRYRPAQTTAAATGFRRIELRFQCPSGDAIVLHAGAFFDLVPTHINMAHIQSPNGEFVEQVLTASAQDVAMDGVDGNKLKSAGFLQFVGMGVLHIFTGVDHMSFLVGLVLISRRFRDLAFVITGFTLGHSLTLALAVTGVLRPHAEFIDALVALTIGLIGAENVAVSTQRFGTVALVTALSLGLMAGLRLLGIGLLPPLLLIGSALFAACYLLVSGSLRDAGRVRLIVTLVFGLIHGFGFAADLLETRIPTQTLAELLVGFNLGVEVGQLTIVSLLAGGAWLLGRYHLALSRRLTTDAAASMLVAVGVYWFVSRSF